MKKLHVEQVAWLALMLSFVVVCAAVAGFRDTLAGRMRAQSYDVLLKQARSFDQGGEPGRAAALYDTLLQRYPGQEELLIAYAAHLEALGEPAKARQAYAEAASLGRQQFSAVRRYASFLERTGSPDEAVTVYENYLERYPDDLTAQLDLGMRYLGRGEWEQSVHCLEKAAERPGQEISANANLGIAYAMMGKLREAIDEWRRVVAMGPEPEKQLYLQDIAAAHEGLGELKPAYDAWEAYLKTFPNSLYGMKHLMELCPKVQNAQTVERMALRFSAVQPAIPLEREATDRIRVAGASSVAVEQQSGATLRGEVYYQIIGMIPASAEIDARFVLLPGDSSPPGDARELVSEPKQVGSPPLWRGDTIRQPVAVVLPADLAPGTYQVGVTLDPGGRPPIPLWTLQVSAPAPQAAEPAPPAGVADSSPAAAEPATESVP